MDFNFVQLYYDLAKNTYHVDPLIFTSLMFASGPPYYWSWYALLKEVVIFGKKCRDSKGKLRVVDIFNDRKFVIILVINRLAWVMPYLYVVFWGENLPLWFWVAFIGWIFIGSYAFWCKLKRIVYNRD